MRTNTVFTKALAVVAIGGSMLVPMTSYAQSYRHNASDHRQQSKNQWRNLAYVGAAAGLLGILNHNNTLTAAGAAGAAYSAYRYEQDRKSQNRYDDYGRYDRGYSQYGYSSSRSRDRDRDNDRRSSKSGHDNGRHEGWNNR